MDSTNMIPDETLPEERDARSRKKFAIMESATRLFAEHGYANCDMSKIAQDLGFAKGTIYLYFQSKQELFFACVDEGMKQLRSHVRTSAGQIADPLERISQGIRAYLEFFDARPTLVELMIQERAIFRDRKRPTYFEHRDEMRGPWRELYSDLIAKGVFRNDLPVEQMLDTVGSLMYGTMFTNYFVGRNTTLDQQHANIVKIVFDGLIKR